MCQCEHEEQHHGGYSHHGHGMRHHYGSEGHGECGCGEGEGHHWREHAGDCGCGGHGFHRRFVSRGERIASLEEYLKDLQAEAQAVQERIAELRAAG